MEDSSTTASSSLTSSTPITWIEVKMDDSQISADSIDLMKESDSSKSKEDESVTSKNDILEKDDDSREKTPTDFTKQQVVKDDNGFTFYKCRFCGLTYNFLTTLKAHERVHDVNQVSFCRGYKFIRISFSITAIESLIDNF